MKKDFKIKNPDRISSYFKASWGELLLVLISGVIYNIGLVAGPVFEGLLVQCLWDINKGDKAVSDMISLAVTYVLVILFVQTARALKRFCVRRFANNTSRNMRHMIYNSLVNMSYEALHSESQGRFMTNAIADVDACAEGMRKFTTEIFDTGIALVSYLIMLVYYDVHLAVICCIFTPFAYVLSNSLKKKVADYNQAFKKSAGRLNDATMNRVRIAGTYRVYAMEDEANAQYEDYLKDYEEKAVKAATIENAMPPIYNIISMLGAVPIIYLGAKNVAGTGFTVWNVAAFTTFFTCFTKLAIKSSKAAKLFNSVQKARVSWGRIKPLMKEYVDYVPQEKLKEEVSLKVTDLTVAYTGGTSIIEGFDLDMKKGGIIGVTGQVASGKSAFGLAFLNETVRSGKIEICGRDIAELKNYEYGSYVSYMGHNPEILSASIIENVLLTRDFDGKSEAFWKVVEEVGLLDEVKNMEKQENTKVGNGGVRLSGGQKARLALARTLYNAGRVIVLDDPFSALDMNTEREIFEKLRSNYSDRLFIILSHRISMFPEFDKCLLIDRGRIVSGSHNELLEASDTYRSLYEKQMGGAEK